MHLGDIEKIGGEIPHPSGKVVVNYRQTREGLQAEINLPGDVNGSFVWKGKSYALKGGSNKLDISTAP